MIANKKITRVTLRERTANASDTEVSIYVADVREFAALSICLDTLERRNLGRGRAIEQASKATWDQLSPKEKRKAHTDCSLPGPQAVDGRRERSSF